jgi:hypothetical protein
VIDTPRANAFRFWLSFLGVETSGGLHIAGTGGWVHRTWTGFGSGSLGPTGRGLPEPFLTDRSSGVTFRSCAEERLNGEPHASRGDTLDARCGCVWRPREPSARWRSGRVAENMFISAPVDLDYKLRVHFVHI